VATYAIKILVFLVLYYQTAAAPKRYAPLGDLVEVVSWSFQVLKNDEGSE